jgi:glycosyltransferase involved in cell wall biosynthesis
MQMAHYLEQFGHTLALHFIGTDQPPAKLRQTINEHFFRFNGVVRLGVDFDPCDILFATHWSTVDPVRKSTAAKVRAYLIQDYEPDFHPVSAERYMAQMTYHRGLYHICHGRWMANKIRSLGVPAVGFSPTVAHDVYKPGPRHDFDKRIMFFGRPDLPRRCFTLVCEMMSQVLKLDPSIELVLAGSDETKRWEFRFPVTNLGHINGPDAAELYQNSDLGVAFSSINFTGAAYDMMACGLPVQDIYWEGVEEHYDLGNFVLLSEPDPEVMARDALDLLSKPQSLARRREDGLAFVAKFPGVEQMVREVEALIFGAVQ